MLALAYEDEAGIDSITYRRCWNARANSIFSIKIFPVSLSCISNSADFCKVESIFWASEFRFSSVARPFGGRTVDGGQVALIGFLYQMMGTVGLRAWAECRTIPVENADMEALLGVIHEGDVYHETGDADALAHRLGLDQPGAYVLIQFKYSQNPDRSPLTPTDLKHICENFRRSIRQLTLEAEQTIHYRIITNRPISRTLRPVMRKPAGQRSHAKFLQPELQDLLQATEIFERLNFSLWKEALRHFACEYGATLDEYEQGISTLVGILVERAAARQALPLSKAELIKAFRGYEDLYKLTLPSIRERTERDWEAQRNQLGVYEVPVRRKLLVEATDRVKRSALIILTGDGGHGKSVAAWHLSRLMLEGSAESPGSLAIFLHVRDVRTHTLSWVVGGWSGIPANRRTESLEQALERLRIANPHSRPVLCMVLDGLDEQRMTEGRDTNISDLVSWFWQQEQHMQRNSGTIEMPIATLIVTCREPGVVMNDWLLEAFSPAMLENPTVKPISVGSYSPQELLDAVEQDLPMHIERFERLLSPQVAPALDVGIIDTAFSPIPKEVLEALAHPAMWYALRRLQPEDHANLLDGNSETLDLLAKYFLSWFYEKAWRRHPQWNRDDVAEALSAIALRAFATQSAQFPFEIWLEVSRCDYILQGRQIHQHLYHEALSAGIIRETGRRIWDWRHPFVGRFLARKATEEGMQ